MEKLNNTKYIVTSSKDSLAYFPNNNAAHFTTLLDRPIEITKLAFIGLRQIFIELEGLSDKGGGHVMLDVFITQASGALLNGAESMLLRRVFGWVRRGEKAMLMMTYDSIDFVPIRLPYLDKIEVIIKPIYPANLTLNEQATTYTTLVIEQPC